MLDLYKTAESVHKAVYLRLKTAREQLRTEATPENVADAAYMLRLASDYLDDAHKEIDKFRKMLDSLGCLMIAQQGGENLKGKYASARGDIKTGCEIPSFSKQPQLYAEMCDYFNVPCDPIVRLHFPAVREHITELLGEGKQLPEVLQKGAMYQEAKLIATKRPGDALEKDAAQSDFLNLEG